MKMIAAKNLLVFLFLFCAIGLLFLFQFYGYLSIEKPFHHIVPAVRYMTYFRSTTLRPNSDFQHTNAPKYIVINNGAQNPQLGVDSSKVPIPKTNSVQKTSRRTTTVGATTTRKPIINPESNSQKINPSAITSRKPSITPERNSQIITSDPITTKTKNPSIKPESNSQIINPSDSNTRKPVINAESKSQIISPNGHKRIYWENVPHWLPKYLQDHTTFSNCEVKSCTIATSRQTSDAVIIYMVGFRHQSPFNRPPGQIWIWYGLESPMHIFSHVWQLPAWKEQINWTMTYRLDSTIPIPYGQVFHRPVSERPDLTQVMTKKKKMVAWVVSNCAIVESGRKEYVDLLNKHLREPVDVYGRCGTLKTDADVFKKIDEEYKFYLGFENSLCYDYITEKFHERQNLNLIVIGRGWGNYSHSYPKNSYIDTRDFNSTKQLADYINYLDKNDEEYLKYLRSKAPFKAKDRFYTMRQGMCEICKRLHQPTVPTHYPDIGKWWFGNTCKSPKDLI